MDIIYYTCFAVGGITLLTSLFLGGGEGDTDIAHIGEGHGDISHDIHAESGLFGAAAELLSIRNLIMFCTFFGMTGSIFTWIQSSAATTLISALGMGTLIASALHTSMRYLRRTESGATLHEHELVGKTGKVTIDAGKERVGKIQCCVHGQYVQLLAKIAESDTKDSLHAGEEVLIIDVEGNTAIITTKSDTALLDN